MPVFEIIIGVLLAIAAILALIGSIAEETVVALGAALLLAGGASYLLTIGIHGEYSKFHAKHEAIYLDLRRQGFDIKSSDVHIDAGYLLGTSVDFYGGTCQFSFATSKIGGVWRVTVPGTKGKVALHPKDVAQIVSACP